MIVQLLACGLAGWRLAFMITSEAGPWNVLGRFRSKVGAGPNVIIPAGSLGQLFSCVYCASVWLTAAMWLTFEYASPWPVAIIASMGVAAGVERLTGG